MNLISSQVFFRPRERLIENDHMQSYDISKAMVRKIFKELQFKQLANYQKNRGVIVAEPSQKEEEGGSDLDPHTRENIAMLVVAGVQGLGLQYTLDPKNLNIGNAEAFLKGLLHYSINPQNKIS